MQLVCTAEERLTIYILLHITVFVVFIFSHLNCTYSQTQAITGRLLTFYRSCMHPNMRPCFIDTLVICDDWQMETNRRSANFSESERCRLVDLADKFWSQIECKRTDTITCKEKAKTWEVVAGEFNSSATTKRTPAQLKQVSEAYFSSLVELVPSCNFTTAAICMLLV